MMLNCEIITESTSRAYQYSTAHDNYINNNKIALCLELPTRLIQNLKRWQLIKTNNKNYNKRTRKTIKLNA